MSIIRCPHCGTANRAGSNFCNSCGAELRPSDAPRPPVELPIPSQPPEPPAPAVPPSPRLSPAEQPPDPSLHDQPWLRLEFNAEEGEEAADDAALEQAAGVAPSTTTTPRLITGIQGLLEPTRLAISGGRPGSSAQSRFAPSPALGAEQVRRIRWLMSEAPMLAASPAYRPLPAPPSLHLRWVFLVIGLAVAVPIFLLMPGAGAPVHWTGVSRAYSAVQALPPEAPVLLFWAYDPATAGELDLVALPLMHHLLERRPRLAVVSLLPAGPVTAQRLLERARADLRRASSLTLSAESARPVSYSYLSGGAAVLPLLARDLASGLQGTVGFTPPPILADNEAAPALVVVFAAHAEAAQQWLEMVQPLQGTPVVAAASAAAGPVLQPYYDSGQLLGLVHGFDGAYSYHTLHQQAGSRIQMPALAAQVAAQNWGQIALLLIVLTGNLLAFIDRSSGE
jgi:hypothetical protein